MSLTNQSNTQGHASRCRQFQYDLCWRPERTLPPGTVVELRSHCLRALLAWKYFRLEIEGGDVTYRWKVEPSTNEIWENSDRVLLRATLHYGAQRGEPIRIKFWAVPSIDAGIDQILSVWTQLPAFLAKFGFPEPIPIKEEGSECRLATHPGPIERFYVYSRPFPGPDGKVRTVLSPEDRFGNPGPLTKPIDVRLSWNGETWVESICGPKIIHLAAPSGVGRLEVRVPMDQLSPDENVINGVRCEGYLLVTGNPVWSEPVNGTIPAFGEIHWHSELSGDGQRPIEEAIALARDSLNMDFVAPGDHSTQAHYWTRTVEALEQANSDGEFATFFGWENSTFSGHENYYFTDPNHPLVCQGEAGFGGGEPHAIASTLSQYTGFMAIAHHTNSMCETRDSETDVPIFGPYSWTQPNNYLRLVELMQVRGNQERNDYTDAWRGWHQHYGASAQDALARGYKLGFTGGTDNHCGWPGRAYAECEHKGAHPYKSVILTGVWTDKLARQGVYDALYARHTWAVWDTRAIVHYTLNGAMSGDEIEAAEGEELVAHLKLSAEDALQSVEIISEGKTVWVGSFSELDIDTDIPLGRAAQSTHFYLRALQRDGGIIYASPVFVTVG